MRTATAADPTAELKRRPAWLRALGDGSPPLRVELAGVPYRRVEVYKHDAFAATARYEAERRASNHAATPAVVLKFSRTQPAFGVPFAWLGRYLCRKERRFYLALAEVADVPDDVGAVSVEGRVLAHAAGHVFVPGRPLHDATAPPDGFFAALSALVEQVHDRGIAVVDLNKAENIIVDDDGRPHLLDFQLSVKAERWWYWNPVARWWLASLQRADRYHLAKHWRRMRPDEFAGSDVDVDALRPVPVRVWRKVWRPVILARRRLFVALGIRRGQGTADTELTAEAPASHAPHDDDATSTERRAAASPLT